MTTTDVVVSQPTVSSRPSKTPSSNSHLRTCEQIHILNSEQFKKLLKTIQAIQNVSDSEKNMLMSNKNLSNDKKQSIARASKLKFKEINEM